MSKLDLSLSLSIHVVFVEHAAAIQTSIIAESASSEAGGDRFVGCPVSSRVWHWSAGAEGTALEGVWTSVEDYEWETFRSSCVC